MGLDRTLIVIAIAAASGVVLARAAPAAAPAVAVPVTPQLPGASPAARDEGEADEPHSDATGDNPYDDAAPLARPAPARLQLPMRDGMLRLPGGRFVMGSASPRAPANERPVRPTSVPPFWMDRTEVTVAAYRACVDAAVCPPPARTSATCTYSADEPDLPISCVHWGDADAYCRFVGKRLPTEREWEYAARGVLAVPFPWGAGASCGNAVTLLSEQSGKSCAHRPARVGTHPTGASAFGVQDLSGNVEEWTADWYVEFLGPGPTPHAGAAHVLRGGGWLSTPSQSRTTARNWGSALEAGANVGFRCAKDDEAAP